jgi:hypothetical protein
MKVSIGILVHNGADTLPATLRSLAGQRLLRDADASVHVVANGCTDDSVGVARAELEALRAVEADPRWSFVIHDLPVANKCGAWEHFVHHSSDADADHLVLLDCDILFGDEDTVGRMVRALDDDPRLHVATSFPVKHVELEASGLLERLSSRITDARLDEHAVCGQLYAGRAEVLRRIHMPIGLQVEDGFIRAMVLTDGFRSPEHLERVRRIDGVRHLYEAHLSPERLVRHEAWLVRNTVTLSYLYAAFEALPLELTGQHAGELVAALNDTTPDWFAALFVAASRDRHPLVPRPVRWRRLAAWWAMPISRRPVALPKVALTTCFDLVVCARAERGLADYRTDTLRHRWVSRVRAPRRTLRRLPARSRDSEEAASA